MTWILLVPWFDITQKNTHIYTQTHTCKHTHTQGIIDDADIEITPVKCSHQLSALFN